MGMLVDIRKSLESVIAGFKDLHSDFNEFCVNRDDKLEIKTIHIVKFIVLCYDKESEIVESRKGQWAEKKRDAAIESGLLKDGQLIKDADAVLYGKNDVVNRMIIRYLSLQFDKDFLMYVMLQELLLNATTQLLSFNFEKPSDASKAKQNVEAIIADIEAQEIKIFTGGDVKALTKALYENARKLTVTDLRPENVISRKTNGEELVDDKPYGNYELDKQRFLDDE